MRWLKKVDVSSEKNRWLISLAYVALLIMLTYLLLPVRFETNDDDGLREIIAGYRTPEPYPKTVFTSTIYGQFVCMLYRMFPMAPWYTIVFWGLLFVSFCCICKSLLKIGAENGVPLKNVLLLYAVLHAALFCYYLWFLQFTVVAGICLTGSTALIYAQRTNDSLTNARFDSLLALSLMVFGILIRYLSAVVVLPFLFLAVLWQMIKGYSLPDLPFRKGLATAFKNFVSVKSFVLLAKVALTGIGAFVLLFGYEWYYDSKHPEWKEFETYSYYRGLYTDFPNPTYEEAPELYDAIGWSPELVQVSKGWFMLDKRISVENFKFIQDHKTEYRASSLQNDVDNPEQAPQGAMWQTISQALFDTQNGILGIGVILVILAAIAFSVWSVLSNRMIAACWMLATAGGFSVITLALIIMGRLPLRMYMCILLPAVILLVFESLELRRNEESPPNKKEKVFLIGMPAVMLITAILLFLWIMGSKQVSTSVKTVVSILFSGCCLLELKSIWNCFAGRKTVGRCSLIALPLLCIGGILIFSEFEQAAQSHEILNSMHLEEHHQTVTQYLVEHPENIYIYDSTSYLLYPRGPLYVEEKAPVCNLFFYGGSLANSPLFEEQLAAAGRTELTAEDFVENGVFFLYQVKYGEYTIFSGIEENEEEQCENFVIDQISKNALSQMLKSDYGISEIEIVDRIDDLYYVYRYLPAAE